MWIMTNVWLPPGFELHPASFYPLGVLVPVVGHLHVALESAPAARNPLRPLAHPPRGCCTSSGFVAVGEPLRMQLLDVRIVDDGHRVATLAVLVAVDAPGEHRPVLGVVCDLSHRRFVRKIDREPVFFTH